MTESLAIKHCLTHNARIWLDGKPTQAALSLELRWNIEEQGDLRLRGTLVYQKPRANGSEVPPVRETIPVFVKAMQTTSINGVDIVQFNLGSLSLGPAVTEAPSA